MFSWFQPATADTAHGCLCWWRFGFCLWFEMFTLETQDGKQEGDQRVSQIKETEWQVGDCGDA